MQKKLAKKVGDLCRLILSDTNTRNLFFFLLLNLSFAFVELTYGLWTNSLGLISDSFHMFFDCSALLLGLAASIVTKWGASEKFTYGFARAEILAGLANGLFLLFIALFIMKEAIERTFEPPEVHHERLFVISVLGFVVNLVGIFAFQHGGQAHHHHGAGGCSHSHSNSRGHDHNSHGYDHYASPTTIRDGKQQAAGVVALDMNGYTGSSARRHQDNQSYPPPSSMYTNNYIPAEHHHNHIHPHDDHHHHHHHHDEHKHVNATNFDAEPLLDVQTSRSKPHGRGLIMQSVFLHIVADTLGSIGVMISALLMSQFGWMIADPLCSLFIAILIAVTVYPLLRDSFYVLMQRIPIELDEKLPDCLQRIKSLNGVLEVHETHFWTLNSDTFVGSLKLEVVHGADQRYILSNAKTLLNQLGVERLNIQIDQV